MIYQLAKTSPYLSGQVRWDMCLSRKPGSRVVAESLYIRPISDNIVYNGKESALRGNHLDNVKALYKDIEDVFFSAISKFSGHNILYNSGYVIDPFDHTYEMGLRRASYKLYNKQFSFLCPIWVSEDIDYSDLKFKLTISSAANNRYPYNSQVVVSLSEPIVDYIHEYMRNSASGTPVSNDLLSFNLDPENAYITGVQVDAGTYSHIGITHLLPNLLALERPLMDFDNIICKQFEQNKIIAQQLININLLFNIQDLIGVSMSEALLKKELNVQCEVLYGQQPIELRDLYTNYSFIPGYNITTGEYDLKINVLDYLEDYKTKDLIYTNKIVQPICHWSLSENPEVMYNMYNGFGPCYTIDNDSEVYQVDGLYYNQANLSTDTTSVLNNSLNWCNHFIASNINTRGDIKRKIRSTCIGDNRLITLDDRSVIWMNNNKFDMTGYPELSSHIRLDGKVMISTVSVKNSSQMSGSPVDHDAKLYIDAYKVEISGSNVTTITFYSLKDELLNFKYIYNLISSIDLNQLESQESQESQPRLNLMMLKGLYLIKYLYSHWITPYKIEFNTSVLPHPALNYSDDPMVNEQCMGVNEYVKYNHYSYVYRYTGNIIPSFIEMKDDAHKRYNNVYHYKQWSKPADIDDTYKQLIIKGLLPEYPRFERPDADLPYKVTDDSFYSLIETKLGNVHDKFYNNGDNNVWVGEFTWLNDSKVFNLEDTYIMSITEDRSVSEDTIIDGIWEKLFTGVLSDLIKRASGNTESNTESKQKWMKNWLKTVYNMRIISFDYYTNDDGSQDISRITYIVKFNLI